MSEKESLTARKRQIENSIYKSKLKDVIEINKIRIDSEIIKNKPDNNDKSKNEFISIEFKNNQPTYKNKTKFRFDLENCPIKEIQFYQTVFIFYFKITRNLKEI